MANDEIPVLTLEVVSKIEAAAMAVHVGADSFKENADRSHALEVLTGSDVIVALCRLAAGALRSAKTERLRRPAQVDDVVMMPPRQDGVAPQNAPDADYAALSGVGSLTFEGLVRVSTAELEWGPNSIHRKFYALLAFVENLRSHMAAMESAATAVGRSSDDWVTGRLALLERDTKALRSALDAIAGALGMPSGGHSSRVVDAAVAALGNGSRAWKALETVMRSVGLDPKPGDTELPSKVLSGLENYFARLTTQEELEKARAEVEFQRGEVEKWRNAMGLVAAQLEVRDDGNPDEVRKAVMEEQLNLLEILRKYNEMWEVAERGQSRSLGDCPPGHRPDATAAEQQLRRLVADIITVVPKQTVPAFHIRVEGNRTQLELHTPESSLRAPGHVIAYVDHAGLWLLTMPDERERGAETPYEMVHVLVWLTRWHGDQSKRPSWTAASRGDYRWADRVAWALGKA